MPSLSARVARDWAGGNNVRAPVASVVIPTRNRRNDLERAIASVRSQTLSDWELVVVDDASSDDTESYLAGLNDPRIRVVRLEQHVERSAARNQGLRLARAPLVLFLDDDDELLPESLDLLTRRLALHPEACASVGGAIHETGGMVRRPAFPKQPRLVEGRLELLAGWVALSGQSLMRTQWLTEVGGWREGLSVAEDQELWLRLLPRGPLAVVPQPVLVHRPHGLARDVPWGAEVERGVVADHLRSTPDDNGRGRRAAAAREHLREAYVASERGAYGAAFLATLRGLRAAPFLLASPLVGPPLMRGLRNDLIGAVLPSPATRRLRTAVRRRRARGDRNLQR